MSREVVVLSGVRTAIGGYGGSLKDIPPSELAACACARPSAAPASKPAEVGHVVFGNIIHTDAHDHYLARVAGVKGGLPHETPALTLNRLCGSGLQAIITAAQAIMLGDADVTVAGGAENMSRSPYCSPAMRWGARMNDTTHDRRDGRRPERSVRRLSHGRHRRECRQEVQDLARGPGQAGGREPPPRRLTRSTRATSRRRSCRSRSRSRATRCRSRSTRRCAATARSRSWPGCKPVFDPERHRDRRQRLQHQRRGGGGGADGARPGQEARV